MTRTATHTTKPAPRSAQRASAPPAASPPATGAKQGDLLLAAPKTVDPLLVKILGWKRGFESKPELEFMAWLHGKIKDLGHTFDIKARGCVAVTVPRKDGKQSAVLFSCHTDTVHWGTNFQPQKIVYDPTFGHIFLDKDDPDAGNCLGADDGAGVWLMLKLLEQKVPGTYVFHRGEEKGGIGSAAMAKDNREWLEQFDIAVAFDRPGNTEVITHQRGRTRCASDKFALALCKAINKSENMAYAPSDRGVFTDTYNYREIIPECVNIGVGYHSQHGKDETLDYSHLVDLLDALLDIDWDALPVDRDPKKAEVYQYPTGGYQSGQSYGGAHGGQHSQGRAAGAWSWQHGDGQDDWDTPHSSTRDWPFKGRGTAAPSPAPAPAQQSTLAGKAVQPEPSLLEELRMMTADDIYDLIKTDPDTAQTVIIDLFAELEAAQTRITAYRNLLGLTS